MEHHRPLILLDYLSKTYADDYLNFDQLVLKNISLSFQQGEFVIIFGPSGSGKSTMLNLIAGLEQPTAGRVLIRSRDLSKYSDEELARYHRLKMGMVFQSFNLIKSLNVWENVALPQTAEGIRYDQRFRQAKHLLKLFGLADYLYRHPNELSGGEQQRVAIARALINNPLLMLVDEPTGNLDTKSADDVMQIFHGLHYHAKHTIILVTHNPDYLHYASRVIYLQDGTIKKQEYIDDHDPATVPLALPQTNFAELSHYRHDNQPVGGAVAAPTATPPQARASSSAEPSHTLPPLPPVKAPESGPVIFSNESNNPTPQSPAVNQSPVKEEPSALD